MKKFVTDSRWMMILLLAAVLGSTTTMMTVAEEKGDSSQKGNHIGHFRHAVFFAFKKGTPQEKVDEIVKAFGALKDEVPSIIDYEWGPSESVEKMNDGFTHCFLVTFKDKAGLKAYLPHKAHQAFVKLLGPHLEKAFVFDYTASE